MMISIYSSFNLRRDGGGIRRWNELLVTVVYNGIVVCIDKTLSIPMYWYVILRVIIRADWIVFTKVLRMVIMLTTTDGNDDQVRRVILITVDAMLLMLMVLKCRCYWSCCATWKSLLQSWDLRRTRASSWTRYITMNELLMLDVNASQLAFVDLVVSFRQHLSTNTNICITNTWPALSRFVLEPIDAI